MTPSKPFPSDEESFGEGDAAARPNDDAQQPPEQAARRGPGADAPQYEDVAAEPPRAAGGDDQDDNQDNVHSQLEIIESELRDAHQRALRSQAELENFRKRMYRELDEQQRYAAIPLIRDLLPVVDNLERAIEAAEKHTSAEGLLEGVKMVAHHFNSVLEQHACRRIEAAGQPFDPNVHEAIGQEPSDEHPQGTVTRVTRVGYQVHDRVVRPAQVLVSSGQAEQQN